MRRSPTFHCKRDTQGRAEMTLSKVSHDSAVAQVLNGIDSNTLGTLNIFGMLTTEILEGVKENLRQNANSALHTLDVSGCILQASHTPILRDIKDTYNIHLITPNKGPSL